jgi:peptidoglycan/xylan/chitin deacetylase (PgdA/CDA1 family)
MITIFMLHRVHPFELNKLSSNENMKVSPEFLDKFIVELKSKGYEFISLDRVYKILQGGEKVKKQIVFTLDDGYLDNYTHAYQIFKKHNVPFAIYITTSFPQNQAILWWYVLEDLILANDLLELSDGKMYECKSKGQKEVVFLEIREIILGFKKENFLDALKELFCHYEIDWFGKNKELCISWEEIIELSKDELCTIAGHTKNHYALNQLSIEEVKSEIIEANKLIEEKTGKKIEHFAYPFGSRVEIGRREFDIVKSLGFKTTTTTRRGTIHKEHKNHLECLPRVMLTEDFDLKTIGNIRRKRVMTI